MSNEQKKLKIVLAEDHKNVRKLLQIELNQDERFEVVAETGNGLEAVELAENLKPDVLVMDIRLPGMDGIHAVQRVKDDSPSVRVVMMSMHMDESHIYDALAAGASGYVVKSAIADLPQAIVSVSKGEIYLTPPISLQRVENYRRKANKPPLDILESLS